MRIWLGSHFGSLDRLRVLQKLHAITADNASNNDTLVKHLHCQLLKQFDDKVDPDFGNVLYNQSCGSAANNTVFDVLHMF